MDEIQAGLQVSFGDVSSLMCRNHFSNASKIGFFLRYTGIVCIGYGDNVLKCKCGHFSMSKDFVFDVEFQAVEQEKRRGETETQGSADLGCALHVGETHEARETEGRGKMFAKFFHHESFEFFGYFISNVDILQLLQLQAKEVTDVREGVITRIQQRRSVTAADGCGCRCLANVHQVPGLP